MKTQVTLTVSRCYSEVTPESAEHGDTSDTGFVYESQPFTFSELVNEIERGYFGQERGTEWLSTGYHTECYATGTEREETLHFDRENPAHLRKYWDMAIRYVEAKQAKRSQAFAL